VQQGLFSHSLHQPRAPPLFVVQGSCSTFSDSSMVTRCVGLRHFHRLRHLQGTFLLSFLFPVHAATSSLLRLQRGRSVRFFLLLRFKGSPRHFGKEVARSFLLPASHRLDKATSPLPVEVYRVFPLIPSSMAFSPFADFVPAPC